MHIRSALDIKLQVLKFSICFVNVGEVNMNFVGCLSSYSSICTTYVNIIRVGFIQHLNVYMVCLVGELRCI